MKRRQKRSVTAAARRLAALVAVLAVAGCAGPRAEPGPAAADTTEPAPAAEADPAPRAADTPQLFGFLFTAKEPRDGAPDSPPDSAAAKVTTATMTKEETGLSGLFGFRASGPQAAAGPVEDLPFGEVVKVCGLPESALGREVATSDGRPRFTLYDSAPESVAPRPQFLTGFRDGCARQFTAALAMFGSAQVHEATRYNPLNTTPYSETDAAYEAVKNRICGVKDGAFCPDNRAKRMDRVATFLSVYRDFGGSGSWMELFLHNGQLAATATLGG